MSGYVIFRNNEAIPLNATDLLTYTDLNLSPDTTYSYSVVAIDNQGNQSNKTGQVTGTTAKQDSAPSPQPTPSPDTPTTSPSISAKHTKGDVNNDDKITVIDLSILLSNFGRRPAAFQSGDVNGDGVVNVIDLSILLSNYGR
jgi:hypothetical protein